MVKLNQNFIFLDMEFWCNIWRKANNN